MDTVFAFILGIIILLVALIIRAGAIALLIFFIAWILKHMLGIEIPYIP